MIELNVGDRHAQFSHVGKVAQAACAGLILLFWEEDFLRRTRHRPPLPHASSECTTFAVGLLSDMIVLQFAQDHDRMKLRRVRGHRNYLGRCVR